MEQDAELLNLLAIPSPLPSAVPPIKVVTLGIGSCDKTHAKERLEKKSEK